MPRLEHAELVQARRERVAELRVLELGAVHAVDRAVLRRQQRLELRVAREQLLDERERREHARRGPVQRGGEQALRERRRAPGRRGACGRVRVEREAERAEEEVGGGLGLVRGRGRGRVGLERGRGRGVHVGGEAGREDDRV